MTDEEEVDAGPQDSTPNSRYEVPLEDQLSDGDCLFYISLLPEVESIWEMQTISQQLVEAHQWNLEKIGEILEYL